MHALPSEWFNFNIAENTAAAEPTFFPSKYPDLSTGSVAGLSGDYNEQAEREVHR